MGHHVLYTKFNDYSNKPKFDTISCTKFRLVAVFVLLDAFELFDGLSQTFDIGYLVLVAPRKSELKPVFAEAVSTAMLTAILWLQDGLVAD